MIWVTLLKEKGPSAFFPIHQTNGNGRRTDCRRRAVCQQETDPRPVSEASKDPKEDSGSSKKTKKDTRLGLQHNYSKTRWWFQLFLEFSPLLPRGMIQID